MVMNNFLRNMKLLILDIMEKQLMDLLVLIFMRMDFSMLILLKEMKLSLLTHFITTIANLIPNLKELLNLNQI